MPDCPLGSLALPTTPILSQSSRTSASCSVLPQLPGPKPGFSLESPEEPTEGMGGSARGSAPRQSWEARYECLPMTQSCPGRVEKGAKTLGTWPLWQVTLKAACHQHASHLTLPQHSGIGPAVVPKAHTRTPPGHLSPAGACSAPLCTGVSEATRPGPQQVLRRRLPAPVAPSQE